MEFHRLTLQAAKHVVFALCLVLFTAGLANGDVAAGRKAFDEGNYEKAMSEWQSAADKGDPEAGIRSGVPIRTRPRGPRPRL